jgi:hypothetical protein
VTILDARSFPLTTRAPVVLLGMSILLWHRRPASESGRLCRDAGGAPAWRNVTPKLTSDVVVTAESTKRIVYGARRRASP